MFPAAVETDLMRFCLGSTDVDLQAGGAIQASGQPIASFHSGNT
jgi:hypothetical protein